MKHTTGTDVRCNCGALLARREGAVLVLQRGGMEARLEGVFRAAIVCYRPECRRMKVVEVAPGANRPEAAAG